MEIAAGYIVKAFVLPPGVNLLGVLAAVLLSNHAPRLRRVIIAASLAALWLCCTPFIAALLAKSLEDFRALDAASIGDAEVIVVLGAGRYTDAAEYGGADTVASDTLERLRYAARLAREVGLPVAVTGGALRQSEDEAVGVLMARVLTEEFQVPVHWVEDRSRNTAENARNLRALLGKRHILLVTHALHMRRALGVFERVGFTVTAAPMGFKAGHELGFDIFDWLPSASALWLSRAALHEWLGSAYYRLRY